MFCKCGCGQLTNIAKITSRVKGWVAGEPIHYVFGHSPRKAVVKEYRAVARNGKTVRVHRLKAEKALGKPLPPGAEVHHVDGTKSESSALVICQNHAYHMLLHARSRILRAGGNPNTDRICCECQLLQPRTEFYGEGNQCRECQRIRQEKYRATHRASLRAYEQARRQTPERQAYMREFRRAK